MSDIALPLITIFCADSGHLRQGEQVPRRVVVAKFERWKNPDHGVPQEDWPNLVWREVGAYSAKMAKRVAQMPEPLPPPHLPHPGYWTSEDSEAARVYRARLHPSHDKPDALRAGSYSQSYGPPIPAPNHRVAFRYRFKCALCHRTVVAKEARLTSVLERIHEAGVACISLAGLAATLR